MYITPEVRLKIVQYYLNNKTTLMQTAMKFRVNYRTVQKWVKLYKQEGETRLFGIYKRPWNRSEIKLEEQIVFLKERDPALTVRKAKEIVEKRGMKISYKGIRGIWKRYGYIGFKKENLSVGFIEYIFNPPEAVSACKRVATYIKKKDFKSAAKILNEIPTCHNEEILKELPERYLSPKRKLEKYYFLFGKIPYNLLSKKLMKLRMVFEKAGYLYSALRAGLLEALCYAGSGKIERQVALFSHLRELYPEEKLDPALRFSFYCIKGIAYLRNLKIKDSLIYLRKCELLIKRFPTTNFIGNLLIFYDNFGYNKKIENILKKYKNKLSDEDVFFLKCHIYIFHREDIGIIELLFGSIKKIKNRIHYICFMTPNIIS